MRRLLEAACDVELLWPSGAWDRLGDRLRPALALRCRVVRPVVSTPQRSTWRGRRAKRELDSAIVAEWLVKQFVAGTYPGLVAGSPLAERPEKPSRNPAFAKGD